MFLATAVLALSISVTGASKKPEAPVSTFDQQYMKQIDKTNTALRDYTNTPCVALEFEDVSKNLEKEATILIGMYHSIPETEDEVVQAKEIELYIGFAKLLSSSVDAQQECIDQLKKRPPLPEGSKGSL